MCTGYRNTCQFNLRICASVGVRDRLIYATGFSSPVVCSCNKTPPSPTGLASVIKTMGPSSFKQANTGSLESTRFNSSNDSTYALINTCPVSAFPCQPLKGSTSSA